MHTYTHTYIHTYQLVHTQLAHTYSSTHNLLHTNPSPSLFSFLLSACRLYLSFAACWKKLTCGVIRSFNNPLNGIYPLVSVYIAIEWKLPGLVNIPKNDGTSPCLMGKSTIAMAIFNNYFDITRGYPFLPHPTSSISPKSKLNSCSLKPATNLPICGGASCLIADDLWMWITKQVPSEMFLQVV